MIDKETSNKYLQKDGKYFMVKSIIPNSTTAYLIEIDVNGKVIGEDPIVDDTNTYTSYKPVSASSTSNVPTDLISSIIPSLNDNLPSLEERKRMLRERNEQIKNGNVEKGELNTVERAIDRSSEREKSKQSRVQRNDVHVIDKMLDADKTENVDNTFALKREALLTIRAGFEAIIALLSK